jgi:hypothetical protein
MSKRWDALIERARELAKEGHAVQLATTLESDGRVAKVDFFHFLSCQRCAEMKCRCENVDV